MHALGVSLGVARGHEALHGLEFFLFGEIFSEPAIEVGFQLGIVAAHQGVEHFPGEKLGAVDALIFADDLLLPDAFRIEEVGIGDRLEKVGAGEVQAHGSVVGHDGELELLGVDRELVIAEADNVLAVDEQLGAVLELADGVLANALEPGLQVVGLDAVAELG